MQRPSKRGCTRRALNLLHGTNTGPELVYFQPGYDFVTPDTLVTIIWETINLLHNSVHLQHLNETLCTVGLFCFRHHQGTAGRSAVFVVPINANILRCGVIGKRLAHDIPAFIVDGKI